MTERMTQAGAARRTGKGQRAPRTWRASLMQLRESYGLSRQTLKRALHASASALAKWEKGTSPPTPGSVAKIKQLEKIIEGLSRVMKKDFIRTWLTNQNDACEGKSPLDLLAKGDYESVEDLVYFLEAGEPV